MIVAVSSRVTKAQNYYEMRNSISYDFISYLDKLSISSLIIPNNLENLDKYLSEFKIDGIILTGGNNINPNKYNSYKKLSDVYVERDQTEAFLFDYALSKNIPILGICRGFQFINVHLGGSLTQNIIGHVNVSHELISDNKLFNKKIVNSYHNQGIKIDQLSKILDSIAITKDNFVEAYENKSIKVLGFQWHPERSYNSFDSNLIIKHFIN